jgi:Flp pilus assembly protein TadG
MFEYAFSLSILLSLMFGIMDFGRTAYAYHFVSYASHEAARWASLRGSACKPAGSGCPAVAADVKNYVVTLLPPGVTYNAAAAAGTPGYLSVTTTWPGSPSTAAPSPTTTCGSGTNNAPGQLVCVQVQYTFGFSLPYLSNIAPINMISASRLTISQ